MQNHKPYFTLLTVCYNSQDTISKTIESVLAQTNLDYEYIIIDGKSSDNTTNVIKSYLSCFNGKLKYISEPDSGIYNAMNKGIRLAKGRIIGIVNSDDWLDPNALEIIADCVCKTGYENTIFCGSMNFHYLNGVTQILKTNSSRFFRYTKKYSMGLNHPATFVPLSIYKKYGCFDENLKISADLEFILRVSKNGVKFKFIDQVLTNMSDGGVSSSFSVQQYNDRKYILKKYTKNQIEYYSYICFYITKNIIRLFIPNSLLMKFRKNNRK